MAKNRINMELSPALRRRMRVHAALEETSISEVVRAALDAYLPSLTSLSLEIEKEER